MPSAESRVDELKQLQGSWIDSAGNMWKVTDYKAVVELVGGGSQTHFLSVLPAGRVGLLDARVTRFEQKGMQWSDGDRWLRPTADQPVPSQPSHPQAEVAHESHVLEQTVPDHIPDHISEYPTQHQQVVSNDNCDTHRFEALLAEKDVIIKNLMQKVADLEYQLEHTTPFPFPPPRKPSIARERSDSLPPTSGPPADDSPAVATPVNESRHSVRRASEVRPRSRAHSLFSETSASVLPPAIPRTASRDISNRETSASNETFTTSGTRQVPMSPPTPRGRLTEEDDVPPPMVVTTSEPAGEAPPSGKPLSIIEIRRMKMGLMSKSATAPTRRFG